MVGNPAESAGRVAVKFRTRRNGPNDSEDARTSGVSRRGTPETRTRARGGGSARWWGKRARSSGGGSEQRSGTKSGVKGGTV